MLDRAKRRLHFTPRTLGADKGFFHENFLEALFARGIEPHVARDPRGCAAAHARVRMRARGRGDQLSQRGRKLIEELFGEGKDWHGLGFSSLGIDEPRSGRPMPWAQVSRLRIWLKGLNVPLRWRWHPPCGDVTESVWRTEETEGKVIGAESP